jgi:phage-related protein
LFPSPSVDSDAGTSGDANFLREIVGEDIKTVQFGWPLGMPLIRKLEPRLWEVRSKLKDRIARVIFTVYEGVVIVLLHGFIKKTQKTPVDELNVARKRLFEILGGGR